jgi:hypothetical protein
MDQQSWEDWRDLFVDDLRASFPDDGGTHIGADAFVRHVSKALEGAVSMHEGHLSELEFTAVDSARGIWAMSDEIRFPPGSPKKVLRGSGWYYEEYRRSEGGDWRFASLTLKRQLVEVDGELIVRATYD